MRLHDKAVINSLLRLASKMSSQQQKPGRLTHFICLPLVTKSSRPALDQALQTFRTSFASTVPAKAIRPVDTLHLTLGVMSLDEGKLRSAMELLASIDVKQLLQEAHGGQAEAVEPLAVDLQGLESMHDPARTSILYAAPKDKTNRLEPFCLAVRKAFLEQDLLIDDDRPLKLHATIVNTVYAKGAARGTGHGPKARNRLTIDARGILDSCESFVWTEALVLDRLSICEMGAKKHLDQQRKLISESYTEVASISLPS